MLSFSDTTANKQKHCPWCWNWRTHLHLESSAIYIQRMYRHLSFELT